ncbi:uncharacterized protein LOC131010195 [Salvia miltiorrhiza]|uniref:uncharacterized protein LOC131010195 n=1 Tax=Salvia miltiorrhiza TaxID=226208 RepID=UPI0025AB673A|nr:uncharacterized protein LOC131010195 [Salvia miltiorrhiza]
MEKENAVAHEDFIGRDPKKFCKAFIEPAVVCDMILNNVSETFNGYILNARGKHLIHMLEEIRTSLMERQYRKLEEVRGNNDLLCPSIRKKLDKLNMDSRFCITHPALGGKFEVDLNEDRFVVDVGTRSCTCRQWDITGIPCPHGCAVINFLKEDVAGYVHEYYSLAKYKDAYAYGLPPLNGEKMWPRAEGYPVKPPLVKKMPGRPKKKRKRDPLETNPSNSNRLRKICKMTCQKCFQQGHNSRGCKNQPIEKPTATQGKRGRPRKVQVPESGLLSAEKARASTPNSRPRTDKAVLVQEKKKAGQGNS